MRLDFDAIEVYNGFSMNLGAGTADLSATFNVDVPAMTAGYLTVSSGADVYVSGPSARAYLDPARFAERGVDLVWKSYDGYPEYPQFHPPFVHGVSILDLLFHTGADASHYIWGWRTA